MNKVISICLLTIACMFGSCGFEKHPDSTDAEIEAASETGRRDAEQALEHPRNSMARERAMLEMRARETALRDAAHPSCADAYAAAVDDVLNNENEQ